LTTDVEKLYVMPGAGGAPHVLSGPMGLHRSDGTASLPMARLCRLMAQAGFLLGIKTVPGNLNRLTVRNRS
jgi:hypothetical protein